MGSGLKERQNQGCRSNVCAPFRELNLIDDQSSAGYLRQLFFTRILKQGSTELTKTLTEMYDPLLASLRQT
ncbi:hypothetical protein NFI96_024991 [Prochilodus magdalenae]|nr:hypothetical protein NFI96_024991 [Prochilodus magdalenae]